MWILHKKEGHYLVYFFGNPSHMLKLQASSPMMIISYSVKFVLNKYQNEKESVSSL